MGLSSILNGKQTAAVLCYQVGDSGKGKVVDILADWADVTVRCQGGSNAGHTRVIGTEKHISHLIPSGIAYDAQGKINILGNGIVLDIRQLCKELDLLDKFEQPYDNLMISEDAHVTLPFHVQLDVRKNASQKSGGIGSTGRGIGPTYADKISRNGVMVRDLFKPDVLARKVTALAEIYRGHGIIIEPDSAIAGLSDDTRRIKPLVRNTIRAMHEFMRQGKRILLEGAQGLWLSIEHGTYPYVTSSDCSINGVASGAGISAQMVDQVFGIVKFPYMTRVGAGPLPSEFGGRKSEDYCAKGLEHDVVKELTEYNIPFTKQDDGFPKYDHAHPNILTLINSDIPFLRGIGIRLAGEEFGATTGRPRRTGWTDLPALKYAVNINGPDVILTKADVLEGANQFSLCAGYYLRGKQAEFTRDSDELYRCKPWLISFDGYNEKLSEIRSYKNYPKGLKDSIALTEILANCRVRAISTGPERSQYLVVN